MPRRPASRPWGGRNHCGGPRAAADPVADVAVLTVEPGPVFVARLREALRDAPAARRILVHAHGGPHTHKDYPSPLAGEGAVGVHTMPMSDTVKEVVDGRVRRTVPRDTIVHVTGPWVFERDALAEALTRVGGGEAEITDLIGLCQAAHLRVRALPTR